MSDEFLLKTPHFTLEGRSRAGHETWFRIRELGIALDIGRGPDAVVSMPHVFISHAHLDHFAGMPFYATQRRLQGMGAGTIYLPAESLDDVQELVALYEKITGGALEAELVGVAVGDELRLGRNHVVRAHRATHRVAARGYEIIERRHHLIEDFAGLAGQELAALRRDGTAIETTTEHSLLFYTGDTDRGILETCTFSRGGPAHRMLVRPRRGSGSRREVPPHSRRRHCGLRRQVRERPDRADALQPPLLARRDPRARPEAVAALDPRARETCVARTVSASLTACSGGLHRYCYPRRR